MVGTTAHSSKSNIFSLNLFSKKSPGVKDCEREYKGGNKATKAINNMGNTEEEYEVGTEKQTSFIRQDHWTETKVQIGNYVPV